MNYLAHIYLSGKNRGVQIGNFVGDAVKGKAYERYPLDFQHGILLHRQIDAFSDAHPLVKEAVYMGREHFGRYSGVVTDILWDHFLAVDFRDYTGTSLRWYTWGFYVALVCHYSHLPSRFRGFLWYFITTNRLMRYASAEGVRESLEIMVQYRGVKVNPAEVVLFLETHYGELQALFRRFFPELQAMCREAMANDKRIMMND